MEMFEVNQASIERFQLIIENYETLVRELNQELCDLKNEQDNLKTQLIAVVAENNTLSKEFQNTLTLKQRDINCGTDNQEIITNLRDQINTLITEKEYVTKVWQEGVKTIDHLEDELKVFQAGYESFVPKKEFHKLKHFYEDKINDLTLKLSNAQIKLEENIRQANAKIEVKHCEIDQSLENQASVLKIVKNLEAEILKLQKRLQETVEDKVRLERSLEKKEDSIQGLKKTNSDCLRRVTEAVSIVEAALNEKDAALFRENEIKEENEKLVQEMTEIVKESQEKINKETARISMEYNEKQKSLLEELGRAHNEIKIKCTEIEAMNKKCSLLENEIERMQRGHCSLEGDINKLLILEKNLESTFQKLLMSEKQNIQLISDKEVIKSDLDQMASIYDRNLRAKEVEICTLKSKTNRLETELNESYKQVNQITERMSKVNEQIVKTEREFKNQKGTYETGLKTTYDEKIEQLSRNYNNQVREMHLQMEKKNEINQKWRKETKIITENLEKLVSNLKQDVQVLKKENRSLREILRKSEGRVHQYKTFLALITKDVNKISHLTLGATIS